MLFTVTTDIGGYSPDSCDLVSGFSETYLVIVVVVLLLTYSHRCVEDTIYLYICISKLLLNLLKF